MTDSSGSRGVGTNEAFIFLPFFFGWPGAGNGTGDHTLLGSSVSCFTSRLEELPRAGRVLVRRWWRPASWQAQVTRSATPGPPGHDAARSGKAPKTGRYEEPCSRRPAHGTSPAPSAGACRPG